MLAKLSHSIPGSSAFILAFTPDYKYDFDQYAITPYNRKPAVCDANFSIPEYGYELPFALAVAKRQS